MLVTPIGKITSLDSASDIDAAYPSGSGGGTLGVKEILRASVVKIDNASNKPVCARVVSVSQIEASTGETYSHGYTIDQEVGNYMDMMIKPGETVYIRKDPGQTVFDDPNIPTYVTDTSGETIEFRLAPDTTAGTGYVYASPVTIAG